MGVSCLRVPFLGWGFDWKPKQRTIGLKGNLRLQSWGAGSCCGAVQPAAPGRSFGVSPADVQGFPRLVLWIALDCFGLPSGLVGKEGFQ